MVKSTLAAIISLGVALSVANAATLYWNNGPHTGDQSVNNVSNYSSDQAGTTIAAALPATNDIIYFYADTAAGQTWLSNPWEVGALEIASGSPWPWINGPTATPRPVILNGATVEGVDNCVIHVRNTGGSIPGGPVWLKGGGPKVIYTESASAYEIFKGVAETNGSASLIIDGTIAGRVLIESGINITGELIITNGTLMTDYAGGNPPSTNLSSTVLRIWGPNVGGSGRFSLEVTNLTYFVKGLEVDQPTGLTNYPPGSYTAVTGLGYTRFETAPDGNSATIVVLPPAIASPPVITNIAYAGATVTLSGTNGTSGASFSVRRSASPATPMNSWSTIAGGTFGAGGAFSISAPTSGSIQFYRLSVP